jgi:hypothetical protein
MSLSDISVRKVDVSAYTIPTDAPEGDGILRWDSTTLIICELHAADEVGFGYSYDRMESRRLRRSLQSHP